MGKVRVSREDLKRDEVKDLGYSLMDFYRRQTATIWTVVLAVLALLIAIKLYGNYQEARLTQSNRQYSDAWGEYGRAMMVETQAEREESLEKVIRLATDLAEQFPNEPAGRQALLLQGNAALQLNQPERARVSFQQFFDHAKPGEETAEGYLALGYAFENEFFDKASRGSAAAEEAKSLAKQAKENYVNAIKISDDYPYVRNQAYLAVARLHEVTGAPDEAIGILQELLDKAKSDENDEDNRYGKAPEEKPKRADMISDFGIGTASEVYGAVTIAKEHIDRLKALVEADEAGALVSRAFPQDAPSTATLALRAGNAGTSATLSSGTTPGAGPNASPSVNTLATPRPVALTPVPTIPAPTPTSTPALPVSTPSRTPEVLGGAPPSAAGSLAPPALTPVATLTPAPTQAAATPVAQP